MKSDFQKVSTAGKGSKIESFRDPTIATGHFLIDLLDAVQPGSINYSLVEPGGNRNEF